LAFCFGGEPFHRDPKPLPRDTAGMTTETSSLHVPAAAASAAGIDDLYLLVLADGLPLTQEGRTLRYRTVRLRETTVADERAAVRLAERAVLVAGDYKLLVSEADFRYAMTMMHCAQFECDGMVLPQAMLDAALFGKLSAHDLELIEARIFLMQLAAQVRYGRISAADFAEVAAGRSSQALELTPSPQPVGQTANVGAGAAASESGPTLLADYVAPSASGAA
jgi:phage FluMu protein gp41